MDHSCSGAVTSMVSVSDLWQGFLPNRVEILASVSTAATAADLVATAEETHSKSFGKPTQLKRPARSPARQRASRPSRAPWSANQPRSRRVVQPCRPSVHRQTARCWGVVCFRCCFYSTTWPVCTGRQRRLLQSRTPCFQAPTCRASSEPCRRPCSRPSERCTSRGVESSGSCTPSRKAEGWRMRRR